MQKNIITLIVAGVIIAGLFGGASYFKKDSSDKSYEGYYTQSASQKNKTTKVEGESTTHKNESEQKDDQIVLYYGQECPHCHEIIEYLNSNKVSEKINYDTKEVWHNQQNQAEMMEKVKVCKLNPQEVGVPFLYAEGECYMGTPDVEAYFKKQIASSSKQ